MGVSWSPTLLIKAKATSSNVFIARIFSSTDCKGSNGTFWSALSTRAKSQEGIEGRRGGFNLPTPRGPWRPFHASLPPYLLWGVISRNCTDTGPVSGSKRCHPQPSKLLMHLREESGGAPKDTAGTLQLEGPPHSPGNSTGHRVREGALGGWWRNPQTTQATTQSCPPPAFTRK